MKHNKPINNYFCRQQKQPSKPYKDEYVRIFGKDIACERKCGCFEDGKIFCECDKGE